MTIISLSKATTKQLWTIVQDDWDCPKELMESVVQELLQRKGFDHLIKHLINKMFYRWDKERQYNFNDLYSLGYIGVIIALKNYKVGKGSFKTFAYMNIKSEFVHHLEKINSGKRKMYKEMLSLDVPKHENNETTYYAEILDENQNVEKHVINKLFWNENFSRINDTEKDVLVLFAEGYSFNEIARLKGYKGAAFISKVFHRAAEKINPHYEKKSLKEKGLMTRTKESVAV